MTISSPIAGTGHPGAELETVRAKPHGVAGLPLVDRCGGADGGQRGQLHAELIAGGLLPLRADGAHAGMVAGAGAEAVDEGAMLAEALRGEGGGAGQEIGLGGQMQLVADARLGGGGVVQRQPAGGEAFCAGGGELDQRRWAVPDAAVADAEEGAGEECRHLLARDRLIRAVAVGAAAGGDAKLRQTFDVAAGPGARVDVGKGRDTSAVIRRRLALHRANQERGHLLAGDQIVGAVVAGGQPVVMASSASHLT